MTQSVAGSSSSVVYNGALYAVRLSANVAYDAGGPYLCSITIVGTPAPVSPEVQAVAQALATNLTGGTSSQAFGVRYPTSSQGLIDQRGQVIFVPSGTPYGVGPNIGRAIEAALVGLMLAGTINPYDLRLGVAIQSAWSLFKQGGPVSPGVVRVPCVGALT